MGGPKALVELEGRLLVHHALSALRDGGCAPLIVVVGAAAEAVRAVLPPEVHVAPAHGWAEGMGASLRAGLAALEELEPVPEAVLVHLVDLPGVTAAAIARLTVRVGPDALIRASYDGRPAHPVLIGRSHWSAVSASATGDSGARAYLSGNTALQLVECADVADPADVDTPEQLARYPKPASRGLGARESG